MTLKTDENIPRNDCFQSVVHEIEAEPICGCLCVTLQPGCGLLWHVNVKIIKLVIALSQENIWLEHGQSVIGIITPIKHKITWLNIIEMWLLRLSHTGICCRPNGTTKISYFKGRTAELL